MSDSDGSKNVVEHVERVATKERVPGHTNYYEKNGVRTYGDGEGKVIILAQPLETTDLLPRP